jgi:hypothetical protein
MLRAQKIEISPEKIVDLTYDFDATSVYWPNAKSFDWQKEYWDMSARDTAEVRSSTVTFVSIGST